MLRSAILVALATLAGCNDDETLTQYNTSDSGTFVLQSIDGTPFTARATLDVSTPGKLAGDAPCNRYFADQTVPYPWFEAGPIGATKRACPDLEQESAFFDALAAMQFAEFLGDTLLLTNEAGREMLFQAAP